MSKFYYFSYFSLFFIKAIQVMAENKLLFIFQSSEIKTIYLSTNYVQKRISGLGLLPIIFLISASISACS